MPLPIFHLGAARLFAADQASLLDSPDFYLGSIAPDAILFREGSNHTLKDAVHLRNEEPDVWEAAIMDFVQKNRPLTPFTTGYAVHLLTDCFWRKAYYHRLAEKFNAAETPMEERSETHHREQGRLSYRFYCEDAWVKELFLLLRQAEPTDFPPFVSAKEINSVRNGVVDWYENGEHIPTDTTTVFLNKEMLAAFMEEASDFCKKKLSR